MLDTLHTQVGGAVWLGVCALALWLGGRPERIAAILLALGWLISVAMQGEAGAPGVYWVIAAIDLALLLVFVALAWKNERSWPVWAAAAQLVLVASHVVARVDLRITSQGYITVLNLLGYAVLACVAVGAFQAWRDRRLADR